MNVALPGRVAPAAPAATRASSGRLHHIDALRAIAALLVVWMHVSEKFVTLGPATMRSRWVHDLASLFDVGRIGVVVFFAISGFVIPFSLSRDSSAPVRDFLLRRAFRIAPAYWLSIPIGAFACHMIWGRSFPLRDMLLDMTLLQYAFDGPTAMGLYWTLAVEALFYLACAGLLLTHRIRNYTTIAAIAAGLVLLHLTSVFLFHRGNFTTLPYLTSLWFLHLGIMFWGTLYRASRDGSLTGLFARGCMWAILLLFLIVYPLYCALGVGFPFNYYAPYALAFVVFLLGTTVAKVSWRPLVRIGETSYSVYLLHPIVFNLALWLLMRTAPGSWWRDRHLGVYVVACAAATIPLAALVYRRVEQPAIALGRRLSRRWIPANPPPLAAAAQPASGA